MAIEFFTGFEGCGSIGDIQCLFTTINSSYMAYSATNGFNNGKCLRSVLLGWITKTCLAAKTKTAGFHVNGASKNNYEATTARSLMQFQGPDITIWNTSTGFDIRRGITQIATVPGISIPASLIHFECKVFSDASIGTVQIKINGELVYNGSNLNTGGQDITSIFFGCTAADTSFFLDNIYIADDFQGELISYLLQPNSDESIQFTPNSGVINYDKINDTAQDGDTSYVESATPTHKDLYGYTNIAANSIIKAITLVTIAKKSEAGEKALELIAKQGLTEYTLDTKYLATVYPSVSATGFIQTLDAAPDESAWTPAILNAMQWGFQLP